MIRRVAAVVFVVTLLGCGGQGSDGSGAGGTSASGGAGAGGSEASGAGGAGASMGMGTGAGGGLGTGGGGGGVPVADVHLVGRFDTSDGVVASWSGSSALTTMKGPTASVRLAGGDGIWFEIVVDGASVGRFETTGGEQLYPLASNLGDGEHTIEIVRRNEAFFGTFELLGFEPAEAIVPSPYPYAHSIEFIGDSLTCGYGIEGSSANCNFSGATESAYSAYALVAARELGAAAHVVCYSGKGVHQNYGGNLDEPMPVLYPRTFVGSATPEWDAARFPAEVVVVNLGTNDFSAALDSAAFVADYVELLGTVRERHPGAYLLAVTWAHWGASKEALVTQAVSMFGDTNSGTLRFAIDPNDGLGCDYHTNVVTNAKLGVLLADTLRERLGW
jgi:hypothetical protein